MFAWPESNRNFWKEDCLTYSAGSTVDLSTQMPGLRLNLCDQDGNNQGVARVLRYEGHMLVYDPHTNGVGVGHHERHPCLTYRGRGMVGRGVEKLLFRPARNAWRTTSPPGHPLRKLQQVTNRQRQRHQDERQETVEANVDWDTDDVQDRSYSPSPSAGIGAITLGESAEDVSPPGLDTHLVTDRIIEPGVVPPQESVPVADEKLQIDAPLRGPPGRILWRRRGGFICWHGGAIKSLLILNVLRNHWTFRAAES